MVIFFLSAFVIITCQLLVDFLIRVGLVEPASITSSTMSYIKIGLCIFVFTPASLPDKLHHMQFSTMVMFCVITVMALIIVLETPYYLTQPNYNFNEIPLYTANITVLLKTFAIGMYTFPFQFQ